MIELIRQSAVPAGIMRVASKGALSLPAPEMIEILVHLAEHPTFGAEARLTLAGWDEVSAREVAADPNTPWPVLDYISAPKNLRIAVLPALLDNPSLPDARLVEIATTTGADGVPVLLASKRVRKSPMLLRALLTNPQANTKVSEEIELLLAHGAEGQVENGMLEEGEIFEEEIATYLSEHAAEIKAAEGTPFSLSDLSLEEQADLAATMPPAGSQVAEQPTATAAVPTRAPASERQKLSTVQKVAALGVGERVQLALKGNKDERFVLVRDGVKVVCTAVIDSPKVTDSEIELFASMKNVSEAVLRSIAAKRKFIKNYSVIRNLTCNPRCPIDVSVPLLPHLMTTDLKWLSANKNVADVVRKTSLKMFRDRFTSR